MKIIMNEQREETENIYIYIYIFNSKKEFGKGSFIYDVRKNVYISDSPQTSNLGLTFATLGRP